MLPVTYKSTTAANSKAFHQALNSYEDKLKARIVATAMGRKAVPMTGGQEFRRAADRRGNALAPKGLADGLLQRTGLLARSAMRLSLGAVGLYCLPILEAFIDAKDFDKLNMGVRVGLLAGGKADALRGVQSQKSAYATKVNYQLNFASAWAVLDAAQILRSKGFVVPGGAAALGCWYVANRVVPKPQIAH